MGSRRRGRAGHGSGVSTPLGDRAARSGLVAAPVDEPAARYTPEQLFYAAVGALAERAGVPPRHIELFRDDVDDPEAVDTLASRDPGFRIDLSRVADTSGFLAALASAAGCRSAYAQILDQLPTTPTVIVPIRGTVS
jgi:hypothetical protein